MAAIQTFKEVWARCSVLKALHAYLSVQVASVLNVDELLRAEWASYVSALDLYVHELTIARMLEIQGGSRTPSAAYSKFSLPLNVVDRMAQCKGRADAISIMELELRSKFSVMSFQDPEKIAEAVRLFSDLPLWGSIATQQGALLTTKDEKAKELKGTLSLIVRRRHKIVHEGDMQPGFPRTPWPIDRQQVDEVASFIEALVHSMDAILL